MRINREDLPEKSGIHPRSIYTMIISTEYAPYFCLYRPRETGRTTTRETRELNIL